MTRRGRPRTKLGAISEAVLTLAAARPVTSLDVARELQLSRPVARSTMSRLHNIGHLRAIGQVRVDGGTRPLRQLVAVQTRIPGTDGLIAASQCQAQHTVEDRLALLMTLPHILGRSS